MEVAHSNQCHHDTGPGESCRTFCIHHSFCPVFEGDGKYYDEDDAEDNPSIEKLPDENYRDAISGAD